MGQALYRKYRSKNFNEIVGQEHITKTLENAIKSGRISHAYLFTGPRGIGKTSVARILAHEVNQLPYTDESVHLDIIEIDAASNRRIDEIRDLRERVNIAPTSAKYKVYIIDEVHMLTREAFNALLKTLEEPPAHCIFILATTEAHKLPDTIISRTQRYSFKPVETNQASHHLQAIAKKENIDISPEALKLVAEHGEGSFRDSISLLDQLSSLGKKIDEQTAREVLGLPTLSSITNLLQAISLGNSAEVIKILNDLREQGASAAKIASQLGTLARDLLVNTSQPWLVDLLKGLVDVPASPKSDELLEIIALEACSHNRLQNKNDQDPPSSISSTPQKSDAIKVKDLPKDNIVVEKKPALRASTHFSLEQWPAVIDKVKVEAASLYTALRLASPTLNENGLLLSFQFPLHQKKVKQSKNLEVITRSIEEITGSKVPIVCEISKSTVKPLDIPHTIERDYKNLGGDEGIEAISNIFGTAEVLES